MSFYYATVKEVGAKCFDGDTIPSENTVNQTRLDFVMNQAQEETNRAAGLSQETQDPDPTRILKKVFLKFCELELDKKALKLPDYLKEEIADAKTVPIVVYDPPTGRY